jgi:hypothetical protein
MLCLLVELSALQRRAGITGDHQILVGLDDIGGNAACACADVLTVLVIGGLVQIARGEGCAD